MKVAAVAACPVLGGKLKFVDDAPARAVPGVRDVIKIDNAVAVTGDHYWAARQGLAALRMGWDEGANANVSSRALVESLRNAYGTRPAVLARHDGDVDGAF